MSVPQAFNKCKREGFRLQTVDKAPLAKRRKMKKTSTSTETRSSSSESTHSSSSSQSQDKTSPGGETAIIPQSSVSTPLTLGPDDENEPRPAFTFTEWACLRGVLLPASLSVSFMLQKVAPTPLLAIDVTSAEDVAGVNFEEHRHVLLNKEQVQTNYWKIVWNTTKKEICILKEYK